MAHTLIPLRPTRAREVPFCAGALVCALRKRMSLHVVPHIADSGSVYLRVRHPNSGRLVKVRVADHEPSPEHTTAAWLSWSPGALTLKELLPAIGNRLSVDPQGAERWLKAVDLSGPTTIKGRCFDAIQTAKWYWTMETLRKLLDAWLVCSAMPGDSTLRVAVPQGALVIQATTTRTDFPPPRLWLCAERPIQPILDRLAERLQIPLDAFARSYRVRQAADPADPICDALQRPSASANHCQA